MKIIVCREKHSNEYYDASTQEALEASALKILRRRIDEGWITDPTVMSDTYQKVKAEFESARTELEGLKQTVTNPEDSIVYKAARTALRTARDRFEWYEQAREQFERAQAAVDAKDGVVAWRILLERSDYEYEGVTIAQVYSED